MGIDETSAFNCCPSLFSLLSPLEEEQEADSHDDAGVGDIECRPMIVPDIKIQKIDDTPVLNSVEQITCRSPENEGQGIEFGRACPFFFMAVEKNPKQSKCGKKDEPSLMGCVLALGKEPEHNSCIPHGHDPEKMGNDVGIGSDRNF